MADKKISELTNITGANLADADEFVVVDTSASETKAITWAELKEGLDTGTGFVRITGDTMTGNLSFGDNDKAIFGAGSDLQIYHNTALPGSVIEDVGSGDLIIKASNQIRFQDGSGNHYAIFNEGSSVDLYHNNALKLATTSTGVDVTGTVTADGLTVGKGSEGTYASLSGDNAAGGRGLDFTSSTNVTSVGAKHTINAKSGAGAIVLATASNDRMLIDYNGDISFYEDTGTTAKFFWDASAESLGIGTSSPSRKLHVSSSQQTISLLQTSSSVGQIDIQNATATASLAADGADMYFYVNSGERMRIDSSGNVGIGTSSPAELIHIAGGAAAAYLKATNSAGTQGIEVGVSNAGDGIVNVQDAKALRLFTNDTERMRIDASGNLLVGKTSANTYNTTAGFETRPDGLTSSTRDGAISLILNRLNSDGDIVQFRKDGTTVGSIGTTGGSLTVGNADTGLLFNASSDNIYPWNMTTGGIRDAAIDLGKSNTRFKDIYAANALIQTSDANEKQDIAELDEAERRVAVAAKGLLRKFRWKDAVAEKGDDARIHFGIIAQDLQAAFEAEGLDAGRYAMFIHTTWTDEETGEERSRMGVRYSELLAFIIAAI